METLVNWDYVNAMGTTVVTADRLQSFINQLIDATYRLDIDNIDLAYGNITDTRTGMNLTDLAVQEKRQGNYEDSICHYIDFFERTARAHPFNSVPPMIVRSFCKTLIAANEFYVAFGLTFFLKKVFTDYFSSLNYEAKNLLQLLKLDFALFSDCSQSRNMNMIYRFAYNVSGNQNYQLIQSETYIQDQFIAIGYFLNNMSIPLDQQIALFKKQQFDFYQKQKEEKRKFAETVIKREQEEKMKKAAEWKRQGLCQYCGGAMTGFFVERCSNCGKKKDY